MDIKLICKNMEVNEVDLNTVTKKNRNPKRKNTVKYISMQEVPQLKKISNRIRASLWLKLTVSSAVN